MNIAENILYNCLGHVTHLFSLKISVLIRVEQKFLEISENVCTSFKACRKFQFLILFLSKPFIINFNLLKHFKWAIFFSIVFFKSLVTNVAIGQMYVQFSWKTIIFNLCWLEHLLCYRSVSKFGISSYTILFHPWPYFLIATPSFCPVTPPK